MGAEVPYNATSQTLYFVLTDSTTGARKTGLANTDVVCSYTREKGSRVAITDSSIAANAAYSSGGFAEVDSTNCPGLYRLDVPNAAFAYGSGVGKVEVTIQGAAIHSETQEVSLVPPTVTAGTVGATEDDQATYTSYTMLDGTVRKDWK